MPDGLVMAMTIGQVAAAAEVNVQTVRYYERRGLMPRPPRTPSGYRQYGPGAVQRLRFIRRAQDLGFALDEIRELLALRVRHASACSTVEAVARRKMALVERKIGELQQLNRSLERLVEACEAKEPTGECPILEAIEAQSAR